MTTVVERLRALREHLATINPDLFDMEDFRKDAECGTHMCVAGHMASMPIFTDLGYELVEVKRIGLAYPHIKATDIRGHEAVMVALGIDIRDIDSLCYCWNTDLPHHGKAALDMKLAQIDGLVTKYQGK